MNRDEKRVFEKESTNAELEKHVNEGAVSDVVKFPLNYVSAFAGPVSGTRSLEPRLENSVTLLARDWANPSTRLDLGLTESLYASDVLAVDGSSVLDSVLPDFEMASTIFLNQDSRLPLSAEDLLAKQMEELSEEVKELRGKIEQQHQAGTVAGAGRKKLGRPPLAEAEWDERFQLVRDIEQTYKDRGITYKHACARHSVPYSTFRYWRRKMKSDK